MKEVLLHIGMHRTGSTSIQKSLADYKGTTTKYATFFEENHSIPIYTIFSERRCEYHIWKNRSLNSQQIEKKRTQYLKILERNLNDKKYDRLIISGEDISSLNKYEQEEFVALLLSKVKSIKVIMFTRSPISLAASSASELIKNGTNPNQYVVRYKDRLKNFSELLGKENVLVEDFDNAVSESGSIVNRLISIIGISINTEIRSNESLSLQAIAMIYKLNSIPLQVLGNADRYQMRMKIVQEIDSYFSVNAGFQETNKNQFRGLLLDSAIDECMYLRDEFGINYLDELSNKYTGTLSSYMEESLSDQQGEIKNFFKKNEISYNDEKNIEYNLLELFVSKFTRKQFHFSNFRFSK